MEAGTPAQLSFYPFAYALFNEHLGTHCWYCLDEEKLHRRCTGCQSAIFCNRECQLLGWKDHKHECTAIKALRATTDIKNRDGNDDVQPSPPLPDIEVRLLGRIVTRQKAILTEKDKAAENFYKDRESRRNLMDIWAHTEEIKNDAYAMRRFNEIYSRLINFYPTKALLSRQTIFEIHCRDFINRHAISDSAYMQEIGKGLYLDLCAYDHSCRPTAIYFCQGFIAQLRPLHQGVNLQDRSTTHYSYIDLVDAKQARRKLLKDTWYFHCECERCVDNSEHLLTSILCPQCPYQASDNGKFLRPASLCPFGEWDYKNGDTQLITCPQCASELSQQNVMEGLAAMRYIGELLDGKTDDADFSSDSSNSLESQTIKAKRTKLRSLLVRFESILPRVNVYYCKLIQALVPLIPLEDGSGELLNLHLDAEECVRLCYPHNHPALGFHLRNIGVFSRRLGHLPQAGKYFREAVAIFEFTMGVEHRLSVDGRILLEEVEEEMAAKLTEGKTLAAISSTVIEKLKVNSDREKEPVAVNVTQPVVVVCGEAGGVKKKASLKKVSPRARTPLPPNLLLTSEPGKEETDEGESFNVGLREENVDSAGLHNLSVSGKTSANKTPASALSGDTRLLVPVILPQGTPATPKMNGNKGENNGGCLTDERGRNETNSVANKHSKQRAHKKK